MSSITALSESPRQRRPVDRFGAVTGFRAPGRSLAPTSEEAVNNQLPVEPATSPPVEKRDERQGEQRASTGPHLTPNVVIHNPGSRHHVCYSQPPVLPQNVERQEAINQNRGKDCQQSWLRLMFGSVVMVGPCHCCHLKLSASVEREQHHPAPG